MTVYVFIDEYGTPELDIEKQGVTPYFVYTGIVIGEDQLQNARDIHRRIVDTYFQGTHMKSSNIKNDDKGHGKRMGILSELSKFNHYISALIVDKSELVGDGLKHKRPFVKFFSRLFDKQFLDKYENCHIFLDKTGTDEFQNGFRDYMIKHGFRGQTLFSQNTFDLKDDITEEPLIQFADFYAGCVGKYYCGTYDIRKAQAINNEIKSRLFVDWFPRAFTNYFGASSFQQNDFCQPIAEIAIKTANTYLEKENDEIGCEIVRILLQENHINPLRLVSSKELTRKLSSKGISTTNAINEIGKLRSKGVFIVSPIGKKGYKLPCSEREIAEYYDRVSDNVVPQLQRGYILHRILTEQSIGTYNILSNERFSLLSSLIDVVVKGQPYPQLIKNDSAPAIPVLSCINKSSI
jgi:biotin operon repressor